MSKKYGDLSIPERWAWHANVYAFRQVYLGVDPAVRTSPCDPDGIWYDAVAVANAARKKRSEINLRQEQVRAQREAIEKRSFRSSDRAAGGRQLIHEWVQQRGYEHVKDYMTKNGLDFDNDNDYSKVCLDVSLSVIAAGAEAKRDQFREEKANYANRHDAAAALGVTAREVVYSPERMRADQIALGIVPPEPEIQPVPEDHQEDADQ